MSKKAVVALVALFVLVLLPGCWLRAAVDPAGALRNPNVQKADKPAPEKKIEVEEK